MAVNDIVMSAAGASGPATYIEDVFSTWLYTGNGSTQTITNGIDLSGKGGLVWEKSRTLGANHLLWDSDRSTYKLSSNLTDAQVNNTIYAPTFTSTGYISNYGWSSSNNIASWTFRKQPKFFDIVTYTGDGVAGRTVAHNLGSVPGCIIVKRTNDVGNWAVYHRSLNITGGHALMLNATDASASLPTFFNSTLATSTEFTVGNAQATNENTSTYVAYIFAHDAGGFGATGTDNVISCGSFNVVNGVSTEVNLGYEPQWVLIKRTDGVGDWRITDNMRGFMASNRGPLLSPNTSNAEVAGDSPLYVTSTGFKTITTSATLTYIYIAIRRPMKTPTVGTSVFSPNVDTSGSLSKTYNLGFPSDWIMQKPTGTGNNYAGNRLTGNYYLIPSSTSAESDGGAGTFSWDLQNSVKTYLTNVNTIAWNFRRAPGFFDVVCYTGTGSLTGVPHNLGVTPQLKIIKRRNFATDWIVGGSIIGENGYLFLNTTAALTSMSNYWDGGDDSATVFSVRNTNSMSDSSGGTYVAYLFATVAGVSKVGSYTGNGSSQTINCGFTTGARFVMIKCTNSTGSWFVWDTARGMVSGTDPRTALNTNGEQLNDNWIYTISSGFQIVTSDNEVNANGNSYIYLAIA